jgi:diguanylate cyclase (GGDEF)-like protein/putative nucleotidyltransferase with HDIG domain
MSLRTKLYIALVCIPGFVLIANELGQWQSHSLLRYGCYFLAGMMTAGLKVTLPSIAGTLSVNFLFILFGIVELTLPETILMASLMTAVQCVWNPRRRSRPIQVVFNVAAMALTTEAAYRSFTALTNLHVDPLVRLVLAASIFFVVNTFLVAVVIALTAHKRILAVWHDSYLWSFPYYIVGAAIAGLMNLANKYVGWQTALLVVPVVYLIYRSYRLYLGRLDDEKKHAEEMAALHLRTIEALALAIEAKDHSTHDHLERVQIYAMEIGKEMGLSPDELEALQAASLLHDIGKLAVPEHIISKPGRLTPEEFDKIKIHPVVGAEILERVQFPYPVAPIVMSHHERWDGSGYPMGLVGEKIPIGARILSAVDCLDALASDRQYRRALPLDDAMRQVASESGKTFDPRVVEVLQKRYVDLEQRALAKQQNAQPAAEMKMRADVAPAAGFEETRTDGATNPVDFLQSIAAARQEVQALFELAQDLGNSLSLDETLSVLAVRLRRMIPCDSMAIYVRRDDVLVPEYVTGDDYRLFSALHIPMGQGLSGWVAENRRPIINGNPSVEPGYMNDPTQFSKLRSALAVPLEGLGGILGVLSLYRAEKDAFSKDHLRILLAISSKVALSVENALRFRQAEDSATIDYLTSLPNARSLFLHLNGELSRARRMKMPVAVLVCDLDGFKQVNDRLGHLEGNKLLRLVAQGLKESCRDSDFVARMGGDEFVLVLPGLTEESVELRCQSFCDVVTNAGRELCGTGMLGMSIGQAFFPADCAEAEGLLAEADRRMYQQKSRNKMRMAVADPIWKECPVATVQ